MIAATHKYRVFRDLTRCLFGLGAITLIFGIQSSHFAGGQEKQPVARSMGRAIVRTAPQLMAVLKNKGYKNVGVLKFLAVREEQGKTDSNVGTLNTTMANRLQRALALEIDRSNPIGLIRNASDVAAKIPGADYMTKSGRKALFGSRYPLAAGAENVEVNAFLTGMVGISKDRRLLHVYFWVVDKNGLQPATKKPVLVANSPGLLTEMGESFRAIDFKTLAKQDPDNQRPQTAAEQAKEAKQKKQSIFKDIAARKKKADAAKGKEPPKGIDPPPDFDAHPLAVPDSPVRLQVFQVVKKNDKDDNQRIDFDFRDGKAFLRDFKEQTRLIFKLTRDSSKNTYGIVLKVNGFNTLGKGSRPDTVSRMWVMSPDDKEYTLKGFQVNNKEAEPFLVISEKAAKDRGITFDKNTGAITMSVFVARKGKQPGKKELPKSVKEKVEDTKTQAVEQGIDLPTASNFDALQQQLLKDTNRSRGGLIVPDVKKVAAGFREVKFQPDSIPVLSATITYFELEAAIKKAK